MSSPEAATAEFAHPEFDRTAQRYGLLRAVMSQIGLGLISARPTTVDLEHLSVR